IYMGLRLILFYNNGKKERRRGNTPDFLLLLHFQLELFWHSLLFGSSDIKSYSLLAIGYDIQ
ncbi:hypothetical protein, partial [Weissella cibaria]|uniref:hypothetical protein n=1 Tax=Weissella cibaria TaxID=137591 RepID=UPI001ADADB02